MEKKMKTTTYEVRISRGRTRNIRASRLENDIQGSGTEGAGGGLGFRV